MDLKSKIILVSGPTASGKSSFAIQLAKKINGEIINADSMQVYKELKILTVRPKIKEYKNVKHHLYGFLSVKKNFSVGSWLKLTLQKIKEIKKKNKVPILVGGTGLYFKALTEGLVKIPNIPIKYRNKIRTLQKTIGQKKFFNKLIKLDPLVKNKIKKGAIEEVKKFLKLKIKKDRTSNKVIGINEIRDFLEKKSNLNEIKERISIKTRQYAKRQSTWARGQMSDWQKINPKDLSKLLKKI